MTVLSVQIKDFRNLADVELAPSQNLNIISGNNGSGKTSLLEAIHYLSVGKSFRHSTSARLIRNLCHQFSIFAQILSSHQRQVPIGILRSLNGALQLRVAESDISSIAELAYFLPTRVINSHSHHLFELGPVYRRKYLDWGLFYHSECFLTSWRHFERALKQRNASLRDKRSKKEIDVWTDELIKYGLEMDQLRQDYVNHLTPMVLSIAQTLFPLPSLEINYQPGWNRKQSFAAVLSSSYQEDMRLGYTQFGPHRADLDLIVNTVSVKHFLSRGQQKLLICAMIIAQGMLLAEHANRSLIYLVDDLPSELDLHSKKQLISLLSQQKTQIFITAIERESICDFISNESVASLRLFHVEHGSVVEMA